MRVLVERVGRVDRVALTQPPVYMEGVSGAKGIIDKHSNGVIRASKRSAKGGEGRSKAQVMRPLIE